MATKDPLYETKDRKVFSTDDEKHWVVELKEPEFAAGKSKKRGKSSLSQINCEVSAKIFDYLESFHVPNFFIEYKTGNQFLAKAMDRIPIQVVVHNLASNHLVKKFGAKPYQELGSPILEFFKIDGKDNALMLNEYHALAFDIATLEEFRMMSRIVTKVNAILKSFFNRRELKLVSFSCEFGRDGGKLTLMSGINMNTCRFYDPSSKPEKDVYNPDNGMLEKAYSNFKNRILTK